MAKTHPKQSTKATHQPNPYKAKPKQPKPNHESSQSETRKSQSEISKMTRIDDECRSSLKRMHSRSFEELPSSIETMNPSAAAISWINAKMHCLFFASIALQSACGERSLSIMQIASLCSQWKDNASLHWFMRFQKLKDSWFQRLTAIIQMTGKCIFSTMDGNASKQVTEETERRNHEKHSSSKSMSKQEQEE